jgi:hypothetical protein
MGVVELHQAFAWDCEECGRENFERAVQAEMTPEEAKEFAAKQGVISEDELNDPDFSGCFLMAPKSVKCKHCGNEFLAEVME